MKLLTILPPQIYKSNFKTDVTSLWRYSSIAYYWVLDINNGDIKPVFNDVDKISTASWSPDSSKIAFIYENNLYYKSLNT